MKEKAPVIAEPPEEAMGFFAGIGTGWMGLIKILEIAGGVLGGDPKTRNFGLLVLGLIVVNILACNWFLMGGVHAVLQPPVLLVSILSAYLLWDARKQFLGLLN